MDQSRYWIQKDQPCLNPHVLSSFGDSWEEQAFAEDATGALGGCVWPPRSYTCSFCRREFRSAQALGGHMNVHRRDRARLKKISSSNDNNQVLDLPPTSFDICLLQNPNPNLDLDHVHPLYSSSSSKPPTLSIIRPFSYSFGQDHQKGTPILSCSKFELPQKRFHHIPYLGYDNQDKGSTAKVVQSNSRVRRRCDDNKDDDEDECLIVKKRRIDDHQGGVRPFFPKSSNLVNGVEAESVVLPLEGSTNSSLETLDLELRLGDRRS